jgi:single-stranded-DNA-specific exonuclease
MKVGVMGDYDVDGVTSCAMLKLVFDALNMPCHVFLPSRVDHGYGLNPKSVEAFFEECPYVPDLMIIADSGSSSEAEIQKMKEAGVKKVLVIDHHIIEEARYSKSADALINWRKSGQEMCTAGLVFLLARQLSVSGHELDWMSLAPFAAVATIADVMPIWGDNRIIVRNGLSNIGACPILGLKTLISMCNVELRCVTEEDIGYRVAPCLNASGRIETCRKSYDLLLENDAVSAAQLATELRETNMNRRGIQKSIREKCLSRLEETGVNDGILIIDPEWNTGVVGIVASDLARKYNVPSLVMGSSGGIVKGSARSIPGVSVKKIMDSCSHMFYRYGGHDAAAGATLGAGFMESAPEIFDKACTAYYEVNGRPAVERIYDADLRASSITKATMENVVGLFRPYCQYNNPEPLFKVSGVTVSKFDVKEGADWRLVIFSGSADGNPIPFRFKCFGDKYDNSLEGKTVDIVFSFPQHTESKWGPDLEVKDIIGAEDGNM